MQRILLLLQSILVLILGGNIWKWSDLRIQYNNINAENVILDIYFNLETTLPSGKYLKIILPFTPVNISSTETGKIYSNISRCSNLENETALDQAELQLQGASIYSSFKIDLNANQNYVIRLDIDIYEQDVGFSKVIGLATTTSKSSNALVIDENPVFGWFYWQDRYHNSITLGAYIKKVPELLEKRPLLEWDLRIPLTPSTYIEAATIIELALGSTTYHRFTTNTSCSVYTINDVPISSKAPYKCFVVTESSLEVYFPYGVVSNKEIIIEVIQMKNGNWNGKTDLNAKMKKAYTNYTIEAGNLANYFETQVVTDPNFFDVSFKVAWGQSITTSATKYTTLFQLFNGVGQKPYIQYQNLFIILKTGQTLLPQSAGIEKKLIIKLDDKDKISILYPSLDNTIPGQSSQSSFAYCSFGTDDSDNVLITCTNLGDLQQETEYQIKFRVACLDIQTDYFPVNVQLQISYEDSDFVTYSESSYDTLKLVYVSKDDANKVWFGSAGIGNDNVGSNPLLQYVSGTTFSEVTVDPLNTANTNILAIELSIDEDYIQGGIGLECIFNKYVMFDDVVNSGDGSVDYGIFGVSDGNRVTKHKYKQTKGSQGSDFSRFQGILNDKIEDFRIGDYMEIKGFQLNVTDSGRVDEYAFEAFCGIFEGNLDLENGFLNSSAYWSGQNQISNTITLKGDNTLSNIGVNIINGRYSSMSTVSLETQTIPALLRIYASQINSFGPNTLISLFFTNIEPSQENGFVQNCIGNSGTINITCSYRPGNQDQKTDSLALDNILNSHRIDINWPYVLNNSGNIDFQIIIPLSKIYKYDNHKIYIAKTNSVGLIQKLTKLIDLDLEDQSATVVPISSHDGSNTKEKFHIYCDDQDPSCRVSALFTSDNSFVRLNLGAIDEVKKNVYTSGSEKVGAAFTLCTVWDNKITFSGNKSAYSSTSTGGSQDKCINFTHPYTANSLYCVLCPLSDNIPSAETNSKVVFGSLKLWDQKPISSGTEDIIGLVTTNDGKIKIYDTVYQVNTGIMKQEDILMTQNIDIGETKHLNLTFKLSAPAQIQRIEFTFESTDFPTLQILQGYTATSSNTNNYTISSLSVEIESNIITVYMTSSGSSGPTTISVIQPGFQCVYGIVRTYKLLDVQSYDAETSGYVVEKVTINDGALNLTVGAQSDKSPIIQNAVLEFPQVGTVGYFKLEFGASSGRLIYAGEYFKVFWNKYYINSDGPNYKCKVYKKVENTIIQQVDWQWSSCVISQTEITLQAGQTIEAGIYILSVTDFRVTPENINFGDIYAQMQSPKGTILYQYTPKTSIKPFINTTNLTLASSRISWSKTYRYIGQLSTNKFTIKLDTEISKSWIIYLGFSSSYIPQLGSDSSIDVQINNLPVNYNFARDRLLKIFDLPFEKLAANTSFTLQLIGLQVPSVQTSGLVFIGFSDSSQFDQNLLIRYAALPETSTSNFPALLSIIGFSSSFRITRDYGSITVDLLFSTAVSTSGTRLALTFPNTWIQLLGASASLNCSFQLSSTDSFGLTTYADAGTFQKVESSTIYITVSSTISQDQVGKVMCSNLRGFDKPISCLTDLPQVFVVDSSSSETKTFMASAMSNNNFTRNIQIQAQTLVDLSYEDTKIMAFRGLVQDFIIKIYPTRTLQQSQQNESASFTRQVQIVSTHKTITCLPAKAEAGEAWLNVQLSISPSAKFGTNYVTFNKTESSPTIIYKTLPVLVVQVIRYTASVTLPSGQDIPAGGISLPFVIGLEFAPDSNLQISLVVNDTSIISLDKYDITVTRKKEASFVARANPDFLGRAASIKILLLGSNNVSFQLPSNNIINVKIVEPYTQDPKFTLNLLSDANGIGLNNNTAPQQGIELQSQNDNLKPTAYYIYASKKEFYVAYTLAQIKTLINNIVPDDETEQWHNDQSYRQDVILTLDQLAEKNFKFIIKNLLPGTSYILDSWAENTGGSSAKVQQTLEFKTGGNSGQIFKVYFNFTKQNFEQVHYRQLTCYLSRYFGIRNELVRTIFDDYCDSRGVYQSRLTYEKLYINENGSTILQYPIYFLPDTTLANDTTYIKIQQAILNGRLTAQIIRSDTNQESPSVVHIVKIIETVNQVGPTLKYPTEIKTTNTSFSLSGFNMVDSSGKSQSGYIHLLLTTNSLLNVTYDSLRGVQGQSLRYTLYYDGNTYYPSQLLVNGLSRNFSYFVSFAATNDNPSLLASWTNITQVKIQLENTVVVAFAAQLNNLFWFVIVAAYVIIQ